MEASAAASVRKRGESGLLFFDFRYGGERCREQTLLTDTVANRNKLEKILGKIEREIKAGTFDYATYFPTSKKVAHFAAAQGQTGSHIQLTASIAAVNPNGTVLSTPIFSDFADTWVSENEIGWRRSHRRTQMDIINGHIRPFFGDKEVSHITKAEILSFRAALAKVPGRKAETLSPKRINSIMAPLRQILNEAADRYEFTTPYRNIKPLKVPKSDVEPASPC